MVKSITRKPLLFLQTLSSQHVCSRRGFPRLKLRELSGLGVGGIEIASAESTLIQNNIISNNASSYVGGIDTSGVSAVTIIDNLIYGNSAGVGNGPGHAGGLQLTGPLSTIAGNTFAENTTATGVSGESASQVN